MAAMLPVVLLCVVIVVVFGVLMGMYFRPTLKMTSRAEGQVVSVAKREVRDEVHRHEEFDVTIEFTALGAPWTFVKTFRERMPHTLKPGATVEVRYNPGDPAMADLAN
jgi:hypothetical protein